jgi:hypothetical protein
LELLLEKKEADSPKQPPVIAKAVPTPPRDDKPEKCRYPHTPRWKTALEVIAVVAVLAYTRAAFQQLGVMRDTLNLDRPWVGITGSGNFRLDVVEDGPLSVTMSAQNVGRTPALNLVTVNKMETVGPSGHTPDFGGYSKSDAGPPVVLFPGSITTIHVYTTKLSAQGNSLAHLKPPDVEALRNGTVRIYVYGSLWYDDTLRTHEHRTDYCFIYDAETSKVSGGSSFGTCKTHNYAD